MLSLYSGVAVGASFGGVGAIPGAAIGAFVGGAIGGIAGWDLGAYAYEEVVGNPNQ